MLCKLCYYTYNGFLSMVVLGLFLCGMATAQDHSAHTHAKPATLMQGYGDLHHPVSTDNPQAQQFFDQGLRQIYAFNHDEAARSFQRAADLDRKLAMAYWGSGRGCRTQLQRSRQRRPLRSGPYIHTEGR